MSTLSVVVIAPNEQRRSRLIEAFAGPQASIAREYDRYPGPDEVGLLIQTGHDVAVVDLDPDPERALEVVENLCSRSAITVMVSSSLNDSELLVRCMRAGAREFLPDPVGASSAAEALVRAAARRTEAIQSRRATGKLLVFVGAKGGSGVTTLASNFAIALTRVSGAKVALVDLDLQLGDAALTLGLETKFTAVDALQNPNRLDADFLSVLFAKHSSGLSVLGAPDTIPEVTPSLSGIEKLVRLTREAFSYVVVDAGSHSTDTYQALFDMATTVYLVSQVSVADLRNANRFVARYFSGPLVEKLEIVLNRFSGMAVDIDDAAITKALTQAPRWKVPNDYESARRAQNSGVAVALEKNQMARAFAEMAKVASGQAPSVEKKKLFGIF